MNTVDWVLLGVTLLCMGVGLGRTLQGLLENPPNLKGTVWHLASLIALIATLGSQCAHGISLLGSFGSSLQVLAFLLMTLGLIINIKLSTPLVPLLITPLALLCAVAGARFREQVPINEVDGSIMAHVTITLFAYSVIILAAISALLFILQDLKLKRRLKSLIPLPSLDLIGRLVRSFDVIAWLLLSFSIGSGALLASNREAGWSDEMLWIFYGVIGTWLTLTVILIAYWRRWLVGRRLAQANFILFALALLSLLGGPH